MKGQTDYQRRTVQIPCEVFWENKSEYFISIDSKDEMWIPKCLVGYNHETYSYIAIIPEQLALEKGLI